MPLLRIHVCVSVFLIAPAPAVKKISITPGSYDSQTQTVKKRL